MQLFPTAQALEEVNDDAINVGKGVAGAVDAGDGVSDDAVTGNVDSGATVSNGASVGRGER